MGAGTGPYSKLRLIPGGLQCQTVFGSIRITATPEESPPFKADAIAFEEDTWLVMSADPKVADPPEHPIRLMTGLIEARPEPVGSVLVKGKNPLRFLAIVHDVNQDPTWQEEWIESALKEIFRESEHRKLQAIGLPLLGTLHGKLEKKRFIAMLARILRQLSFKHLKQLWLIVPVPHNAEIIDVIDSEKKACKFNQSRY